MRAMTPTEAVAAAFIAQQTMHMNDHGVYGKTRKQRARVKALDVVSEERRNLAFDMVCFLPTDFGPPPHGDTGRMRVYNMNTGEIREQTRAGAQAGHRPGRRARARGGRMMAALKLYVAASAAVGAWVAHEADLNPWQTAATVVLSPAILAAAVAHEVRCTVFER